jgi:1-acyl-sn-glycerol-3-phosphate acyltransferase
MAGIIAFVMSVVLTALDTGIEDGYIWRVIRSYAVAFPLAFICVVIFRLLIIFLVKKTVHGSSTVRPSGNAPPAL